MSIDYDHRKNAHTVDGASAALSSLFATNRPQSLLDVGCGTGTWLKAATRFGITDVFGVDGVAISAEQLLVSADKFRQQDLSRPWSIGRSFDAALCLEVAEHLEQDHAPVLVSALVEHADLIFFSAASPLQPGQHHVNCQWPAFWQGLFNERGYTCWDWPRWRIWDDARVEVWYRQNLFVAKRDPAAGSEPRIKPVIHPDMLPVVGKAVVAAQFDQHAAQIQRGRMPILWYLKVPALALFAKLKRHLS